MHNTKMTQSLVVESSSDGLALQGVLYSNSLSDLFKKRSRMIETPKKPKCFLIPEEYWEINEEFESFSQEKHTKTLIEMGEYSILQEIKDDLGKTNINNETISCNSSDEGCNETFFCVWDIYLCPKAICTFSLEDLTLSDSVISSLKKLESCRSQEEKDKQCKSILETYGSHISTSNVFGGIFWLKMESVKFPEELRPTRRELIEELINSQLDFENSTQLFSDVTVYKHLLRREYDESHLKNTIVSIQTSGGPNDSTTFSHWITGLHSDSRNWKVIDRGLRDRLLPIWKIMTLNHKKDFQDSESLANIMKMYWEQNTGLQDNSVELEKIIKTEEIIKRLTEGAIEWNKVLDSEFEEKCADYVAEYTKVHFQVHQLYSDWTNYTQQEILTSHREVQKFLIRAVNHLDSKPGPPPLYKFLLEQISNLTGQREVLETEDFSEYGNALCILRKYHKISYMETFQNFEAAKEFFLNTKKQTTEAHFQIPGAQAIFAYNIYISLLQLKTLIEKMGQRFHRGLVSACFYPFLGRQEKIPRTDLSQAEWQSIVDLIYEMENYVQQLMDMTTEMGQAFVFSVALRSEGYFPSLDSKKGETIELLEVLLEEMGSELSPVIKNMIEKKCKERNPDFKQLKEELTILKKKSISEKEKLESQFGKIHKLICNSTGNDSKVQDKKSPILAKVKNEVVQILGLEKYWEKKFSSTDLKSIDSVALELNKPHRPEDIPWYFIQKLLMSHSDAVKVKCAQSESSTNASDDNDDNFDALFLLESDNKTCLNPLDVIVTVLMCSDPFVQQELVLNMSMCQFAVPLLLPNSDGGPIFLLWAMRSIIKKWYQRSHKDSSSIVECSIATYPMHVITFIRIGENRHSKSAFLNCLLSASQYHHSFFLHHDMEGGNSPRKISNGLVEMTWYLPTGREILDVFLEPFAAINVRGDAKSFLKEVQFLAEVSSAIFIFVGNIGEEQKNMTQSLQRSTAKIFCLLDPPNYGQATVKKSIDEWSAQLHIPKDQIIIRARKKDAELICDVRSAITKIQASKENVISLEAMSHIARDHGFQIDEDYSPCQTGKHKAAKVLAGLSMGNIAEFKDKMLPFQGPTWKEYSEIEKESLRLKNIGHKSQLEYSRELEQKKTAIRHKQMKNDMSSAMEIFIETVLRSTKEEKLFFLHWMKLKLDSLSSASLPSIREKLKRHQNESSEQKNLVKMLSSSSLGLEHFVREIGQVYEAFVVSGSKLNSDLSRLPEMAAEMLLNGFPVEIIDGNVSNIPLTWVSNILQEVKKKTRSTTRIFVLSVLGVQSTGKSTLLNTLFGLQFAVGAGRCTCGAFMQLIHIDGNLKQELGCDYILVIDTEGLRAPELIGITNKYEHDNEIATLIIGLSDVTLVNVSSESTAEMQDILQIVVHALIRMKEVGKKPTIYFIHQNVSDISVRDKDLLGVTQLLTRLDAVTQAAAKQEHKEATYFKFSDVIQYDPAKRTKYIPSLWHGIPPMAAVSTGYSEYAFELKKDLVDFIREQRKSYIPSTIDSFIMLMEELSNAVKSEDFIFSFRNSIAADAFAKLFSQCSDWTWEIQQRFIEWTEKVQVRIKNCQKTDCLLDELKQEVTVLANEEESKVLEKLASYYLKDIDNKQLIQPYKLYFEQNLQAVCQQLKNNAHSKCEIYMHTWLSQNIFQKVLIEYEDKIQEKVDKLVKEINNSGKQLNEGELHKAFEEMWSSTVTSIKCPENQVNIMGDMEKCLLGNDVKRKFFKINLGEKVLRGMGSQTFYVSEKHVKHSMPWISKAHIKQVQKISSNFINYSILNFHSGEDKSRGQLARNQSQTRLKKEQKLADTIIQECEKYIHRMISKKDVDYDPNYCTGVVREIEKQINKLGEQSRRLTEQFHTDLKLHICVMAVKKFQEKHDMFNQQNDPALILNAKKKDYWKAFSDLCDKRDQSQKAAKSFCNLCLKPSLIKEIQWHLSLSIVTYLRNICAPLILKNTLYFQLALLLDLHRRDTFKDYISYIKDYDQFALDFLQQIVEKSCRHELNGKSRFHVMAQDIAADVLDKAKKCMDKVNAEKANTAKQLIELFLTALEGNLVIQKEKIHDILPRNILNVAQFRTDLFDAILSLEKELLKEIEDWEIQVQDLPVVPHQQLYSILGTCTEKCPFCGVPCEHQGENHQHFSRYHRALAVNNTPPEMLPFKTTLKKISALLTFNLDQSTMNCMSRNIHVKSCSASPLESNNWGELYKDQSSVYWRFVLKRYQKQFAQYYYSKPAEVKEKITWKEVEADLQKVYKLNVEDIWLELGKQ
ncbi:interferon-induced very large GTPase 1-like [Erpetoichthys calabaricus]|nr:interferon-induced very large GTPase 1-like [Erpetoichthys calabaricus]